MEILAGTTVREVGQALSTAVGDVGRGVASRQAALAAVRVARRVMAGGAPMAPPLTPTPAAFATYAGAGSGEGGHHTPVSYSLLPPSHPLRDAPASPYLLGGIYVGRMHTSDGRIPASAAPSSSSSSVERCRLTLSNPLKAPITQRLKLQCDEPLSKFAFKFNLRRYTSASAAASSSPTSPGFDPRSPDPNEWSYDGGAE